jgi:hypothetical protein
MNSFRTAILSLVAAGCMSTALSQTPITGAATDAPANSPEISPKAGPFITLLIKPLLVHAAGKIAESGGDQLAEGVGDLFSRLFGHRKKKTSDDAAVAATSAASAATSNAGVTPSLIYSVDRLDPSSFAALGALEVAKARPTLKTGDVFALRFATNLPGQVRVENVDAGGQRNPLGTYNVLPGQDNRIPRTKGIKLTGTTGEETFNLYFYPCLPPEATGLRGLATYKEALTECAASGSSDLQVANRGMVSVRSAQNLELDDPNMVVAAVLDFKPRDIVRQSFRLLHEAP